MEVVLLLVWNWVFSLQLREETIHYGDKCEIVGTGQTCQDYFKNTDNLGTVCNCTVGFELEEDLKVRNNAKIMCNKAVTTLQLYNQHCTTGREVILTFYAKPNPFHLEKNMLKPTAGGPGVTSYAKIMFNKAVTI